MAPTGDPLEAAARARLDRGAFDFFAGGSGAERTIASNKAAWEEVALRPRVLRDVSATRTETTVLGARVALPVLAAPVGFLRHAHPDGERAWAAGIAAAGTLAVLSSRTSTPIADVAGAIGQAPWWMQVYVLRDRGLTTELVRRATAAGASALVLTGDTPRVARKGRADGAGLAIPPDWFLPDLPGDLREDPRAIQDDAVTFSDVEGLCEATGLPVLVKGVLRGDDARASLDAGAAGVIVSNHGGRQLDGAVATARALAEVAEAVAGRAELYVDGGVRTGVDVLRALALGARAALVGRPLVWALATGGAAGVRARLEGLRAEVEEALALSGATTPEDAGRDLVRSSGH